MRQIAGDRAMLITGTSWKITDLAKRSWRARHYALATLQLEKNGAT